MRGRGILGQDADMLARQAETTRRFGGERYTSTELDLMGNGIWRLLRQAAEPLEHLSFPSCLLCFSRPRAPRPPLSRRRPKSPRRRGRSLRAR